MQVLVTRAEPAATKTASRLLESGHEPIVFPLTELKDTGRELPQTKFDGFVFTSANAVRVLEKRGWRNLDETTPAFCVGRNTAFAALNLGFQNVTHADGGGAKLAEEIHHHHSKNVSKLLYPTTPDRQFDMQQALLKHGIEVENCEVYRMQTLEIDMQAFQQALQSVAEGGVLIYSTDSAKHLLNAVNKSSMIDILNKTRIIAISKEAAKPFEAIKHQNIYISDVPNEISMFHNLDKMDH